MPPHSFPAHSMEVRLTYLTSGGTTKCTQQLSPQTWVPVKEKPQILAGNSLCPVLRQTQRSHCEPHAFDRVKERKLKDKYLVLPGFLEEVIHGQVLRGKQDLGVEQGLPFN